MCYERNCLMTNLYTFYNVYTSFLHHCIYIYPIYIIAYTIYIIVYTSFLGSKIWMCYERNCLMTNIYIFYNVYTSFLHYCIYIYHMHHCIYIIFREQNLDGLREKLFNDKCIYIFTLYIFKLMLLHICRSISFKIMLIIYAKLLFNLVKVVCSCLKIASCIHEARHNFN